MAPAADGPSRRSVARVTAKARAGRAPRSLSGVGCARRLRLLHVQRRSEAAGDGGDEGEYAAKTSHAACSVVHALPCVATGRVIPRKRSNYRKVQRCQAITDGPRSSTPRPPPTPRSPRGGPSCSRRSPSRPRAAAIPTATRGCARRSTRRARRTSPTTPSSARSRRARASSAPRAYEELLYEVYGPGGTAVVVEILTDNRNRTAGEIRKVLERGHAKLAAAGSVLYLFHKKGHILFEKDVGEDKLMEAALEAGADDVRADGEGFLVETEAGKLHDVLDKLEKQGLKSLHSEVGMYPDTHVRLEGDDAGADGQAGAGARGPRRRAERLRQLRHRRRAHGAAVGVTQDPRDRSGDSLLRLRRHRAPSARRAARALHRVRRASSRGAPASWRRGSAEIAAGLRRGHRRARARRGRRRGRVPRRQRALGAAARPLRAAWRWRLRARRARRCTSTRRRRSSARSPATARRPRIRCRRWCATLCGLKRAPTLDASDALAVAICHAFRAATRLRAGADDRAAARRARSSKGIDHVLVDVNGVGYRVAVSLNTLAALPPVGQTVAPCTPSSSCARTRSRWSASPPSTSAHAFDLVHRRAGHRPQAGDVDPVDARRRRARPRPCATATTRA